MSNDDWDADDEDWYDDEDDQSEERVVACPECGAEMHVDAEMCPACGYWLTEADRRAIGAEKSRPMWIRIVAVVVLIAFLTVFVVAAAF